MDAQTRQLVDYTVSVAVAIVTRVIAINYVHAQKIGAEPTASRIRVIRSTVVTMDLALVACVIVLQDFMAIIVKLLMSAL